MIAVAFILTLSGFFLDASLYIELITCSQWTECYSTIRDFQFVGFALLAFECCPYSRTEIKVATFFMLICRIAAAVINIFSIDPSYSPWFIYGSGIFYLAWLVRAKYMGEFKQGEEQAGAYHIFFPVHSKWGLLQSIFLPWHPVRYESRMVSDGKHIWSINNREFVKNNVDSLNPITVPHVKVYLGRELTDYEISCFDVLVGHPATPGWSDCRKFLL